MKKLLRLLAPVLLIIATIFTLSSCDDDKNSDDTSEICQHQWVEADCLYPKTCRLCYKTEGKALGHTEIIDESVAPTCAAKGLTEGKHCSVCNEIIVHQTEIDKLEHSWQSATCTKPKTCSLCEATEGTTEPHNFVEQIVSDKYLCSAATDSSPAKYYYSCTLCKEPGTETFEYGSPLLDTWHYDYYIDYQFGYTTDDWYLITIDYIKGTFSNSATTDDELYVELLYDCNDEISIFLYEYANISYGLVKNNSSSEIHYYEIAIRNEDGYVYSARGQMHPGGDRIYIIDIYHDAVLNLMRTSDNLQFYIEDEIWTTTQYKFDVDMNNFNDVLLDVVDGEHLHTYTTTVIEPTCLKEGYKLYSCECEHYFCEDFVPTLDHIEENGICKECNTVTNAYVALANYVKCNGELDDDGDYYISYERVYSDTQTITYYIYTNSDASTLSFQYEEVTSTYVSTMILMLSYNEELHKVGMGISWSWGDDYAYGQIDYNYSQSPSEWYIYDYTCDLIYPSQAEDYKESLSAGVSLLLQGTQLYVMPDFITMEILGFVNF